VGSGRAGGEIGRPAAWDGMNRAAKPDLDATRELVEEVLRTALALEDVMSALLDELPERAFPGQDNAHVLLEMIVGSVHPAATAAGRRDTRTAIALVAAIRERVLADLRTAAELAKERE
jgi:hypothetical protein